LLDHSYFGRNPKIEVPMERSSTSPLAHLYLFIYLFKKLKIKKLKILIYLFIFKKAANFGKTYEKILRIANM
jgi:hypothetical protein